MTAFRRRRLAAACVLGLMMMMMQLAAAAAPSAAQLADGSAAAAFCADAAAKQQPSSTCGWASDDEQRRTTSAQVPFGGTIWRGSPTPGPEPLKGHPSYYQYAGNIVSLRCKPGSRVVVRAVFKPTQQRGTACVRLTPASVGSVARNVSGVVRCQLELPAHKAGDAAEELAAAVRSREVNCKPCSSCVACPHQALGKWFSDTFYATFDGCAGLSGGGGSSGQKKQPVSYQPFMPALLVNPGTMHVLAKFEVQEV